MRSTEALAPVGAAVTALGTLVCCLPLGLAAGTAMATLSTVVAAYRPWLLGASVVLLAMGIVQAARAQRACRTERTVPTLVLVVCAMVVVFVIFFPQVVATLMADWLP